MALLDLLRSFIRENLLINVVKFFIFLKSAEPIENKGFCKFYRFFALKKVFEIIEKNIIQVEGIFITCILNSGLSNYLQALIIYKQISV